MFAGLTKIGRALTNIASPLGRGSASGPVPTFASLAQAAPAPAPAPMFAHAKVSTIAQAAPMFAPAKASTFAQAAPAPARGVVAEEAGEAGEALQMAQDILLPKPKKILIARRPSNPPSKTASKTLKVYREARPESVRAASAKRRTKRLLKKDKKLSAPIAFKFFHEVRRVKGDYEKNIGSILGLLKDSDIFKPKPKTDADLTLLIKSCVPEHVLYSPNLKEKDWQELCNLILTNFESTEQNKGYIAILEAALQPLQVCIQSTESVVQENPSTPKSKGKHKESAAVAVAVEQRVRLNGCPSIDPELTRLLSVQHAFVSANIYSKNPPPPPPPPPQPDDDPMPPGYIDNDDEFPSIVINGLVFSIGPIFDDEATFGRPLIYIRIHNYDPTNFPNGIYFWSYLSFSEGGMARAYFAFTTDLIIKGIDYTKASYIQELLQVWINKYYKKHFLDKKKNGTYLPHKIMNAFELLFFCNNMIYLQSKYVWDFLIGHYCEDISMPGRIPDPFRNPATQPPTRPPPYFNRHCYAIYNHLTPPVRRPEDIRYNSLPDTLEPTSRLRLYIKEGVFKQTLGYSYRNYDRDHHDYGIFAGSDARRREVFRRMSFLQSRSDTVEDYKTIPLLSCFTTVGFLKVNEFEVLLKDWREKSFWVQGGKDYTRCEPSLGHSPVEFATMGCSLKGEDLKYNDYLYTVFPDCITRSIRASRIVAPVMTANPDAQFEFFERVNRSGDLFNLDSSFMSTTEIMKSLERLNSKKVLGENIVDRKFKSLPVCIQVTILKICELFDPGNPVYNRPEFNILRTSFSGSFLEIPHPVDHTRIKEILVNQDFHTGIKHIIQLVTALALYRDALVCDIFQTYMNKQTFVKTITAALAPQQRGVVEACYISESGTYIPIGSIGGPNTRSFPLYDPTNAVNTGPDTKPYVFLSIRDSKYLKYLMPGSFYPKIHSLADINRPDNSVPVKVYTATCLYRILFYVNKGELIPDPEARDLFDNSPKTTGVEFVVACSSTITVDNHGRVFFAANGNLTPIFSGPVTGSPAAGSPAGAMRRSISIIGTFERYISAGCSLDAKKAEYSDSSGHPQYHDLLNKYFGFGSECYTYFTTFPSFNSVFDKVLQYFHTGFGNIAIKTFFENYWINYFIGDPNYAALRVNIPRVLAENTSRLEALTAILVGPTLEILRRKDAEHAQDQETEAVFTDAGDDDDDDSSSDRGSSTSISSSDASAAAPAAPALAPLLNIDESSSNDDEYVQPPSQLSESEGTRTSLSGGGGSLRRIYTRKIKKHMKYNKRHNKRYTKKKKVRFIRGLSSRIIKNTTHKRKAKRGIRRKIKHKKNNKTMRRMRCVRK